MVNGRLKIFQLRIGIFLHWRARIQLYQRDHFARIILREMQEVEMNLQEAGDAARINHTGSSEPTGSVMTDGGIVHLEDGFSAATREALKQRGHTLGPSDGSFGGYQAIMFDKEQGVYYGASEVRKDGQAAGY